MSQNKNIQWWKFPTYHPKPKKRKHHEFFFHHHQHHERHAHTHTHHFDKSYETDFFYPIINSVIYIWWWWSWKKNKHTHTLHYFLFIFFWHSNMGWWWVYKSRKKNILHFLLFYFTKYKSIKLDDDDDVKWKYKLFFMCQYVSEESKFITNNQNKIISSVCV